MYTPDTLKAIHQKYPADVSERRLVHRQQRPARHRAERRRGDAAAARQRLRARSPTAARSTRRTSRCKIQTPAGQGGRASFEPRVLHQVQLPARSPRSADRRVHRRRQLAGGHGLRRVPGFPTAGPSRARPAPRRSTGKTDTSLFVGLAPAEARSTWGRRCSSSRASAPTAAAPVIRRVLQSLADPAQAPDVGPGRCAVVTGARARRQRERSP